jgi:polysaccharide deacetylase 2 family uncharacterized protein YibQ
MGKALSAKYPISLILLSVLATCLFLSWSVLFVLFLKQGETLRSAAMADGRFARIDLKTGAVIEGNVLNLTPPVEPLPSEALPLQNPTVTEPSETPDATPDNVQQVPDSVAPALVTESPVTPPLVEETPTAVNLRAPLNPAPNSALIENVGPLVLPKAAADGMTPAQYYKKSFTRQAGLPLIAVVIRDLGLHSAHTQSAINLDEYVTFSFSPYAPQLKASIDMARATGHEYWLQVPMEPEGYPANDAGPYALLRTDSLEQNMARLHQVMGTAVGYVGLVAPPAELFSSGQLMGDLVEDIRTRGLLLLQHQSVTMLPRYDEMTVSVNRAVQPTTTPEQLRLMLTEMEAMARSRGYAVISLPASPGLLAELPVWLSTLSDKKIALAPLSAIAVAKKE